MNEDDDIEFFGDCGLPGVQVGDTPTPARLLEYVQEEVYDKVQHVVLPLSGYDDEAVRKRLVQAHWQFQKSVEYTLFPETAPRFRDAIRYAVNVMIWKAWGSRRWGRDWDDDEDQEVNLSWFRRYIYPHWRK